MSSTTQQYFPDADRYVLDFGACSAQRGYAQIGTASDAAWYGNWASPAERRVVTYAEGDLIIIQAFTDDEFVAEIRRIADFHRDADAFKGIDCGLNQQVEQAFRSMGLDDLLH